MPKKTRSKLTTTAAFFVVITLFYQWFSESHRATENTMLSSDTHSASPSLKAPGQPSSSETRSITSAHSESSQKRTSDKSHFQSQLTTEPKDKQFLEAAYQSKKAYAQDQVKQALAEINSHTDGQNKAELMKLHAESIATRQQMKTAAQNSNWEAFLDARNTLNDMMGAGDMLSLLDAIQFNAPKHVFQELLRTGSQFTPDMVVLLVVNNDVQLVEMLISLGFDIHMTDRFQKNALLYSIEFNATNVFAFLMTQNVTTTPATAGLDALDMALESLLKPQNSSIVFVDALLNSALRIQPSHQYLLLQLEQNRPDIYREIHTKHGVHVH